MRTETARRSSASSTLSAGRRRGPSEEEEVLGVSGLGIYIALEDQCCLVIAQ
jgi:hypothetical protein